MLDLVLQNITEVLSIKYYENLMNQYSDYSSIRLSAKRGFNNTFYRNPGR